VCVRAVDMGFDPVKVRMSCSGTALVFIRVAWSSGQLQEECAATGVVCL
jgi:hypothetical protein